MERNRKIKNSWIPRTKVLASGVHCACKHRIGYWFVIKFVNDFSEYTRVCLWLAVPENIWHIWKFHRLQFVCSIQKWAHKLTFQPKGVFFLKKKLFPSDRGQTHSHLHTNECIFNNAIECVHRKWRFENRFRISTWMSDVKESVAFSEVNMQSFMDQLCERHWSGRSVIDGRRRKNGPAYVLHKVSSKFLCASK